MAVRTAEHLAQKGKMLFETSIVCDNLAQGCLQTLLLSEDAGEGAGEEVAEEEGEEQGVGAGHHVVEHHAPAVGDTFEFAAERGLDDVDHAEHGEAEQAEQSGLQMVAGDSGHHAGYPCADKLVYDHGARVFPPITLHHLRCPGPDHGGNHHQGGCYPEEGRHIH